MVTKFFSIQFHLNNSHTFFFVAYFFLPIKNEVLTRHLQKHRNASKEFAPGFASEVLCRTTATCPSSLRPKCYAQPLRRVQGLCAWDAPWGGKKKTSFNWISNCNSSGSLASECECRTQTTRRHSSCEWMNWAWQSGVHRAGVVEGGTLRTVLKGSLLAFWWLTETRWTRARHLANRYAPLQSLILAGCDSGLYSLDTDAQTFGGLHCSSWDFMGTHNHLMSQFIKIHQIFSNYSKFS